MYPKMYKLTDTHKYSFPVVHSFVYVHKPFLRLCTKVCICLYTEPARALGPDQERVLDAAIMDSTGLFLRAHSRCNVDYIFILFRSWSQLYFRRGNNLPALWIVFRSGQRHILNMRLRVCNRLFGSEGWNKKWHIENSKCFGCWAKLWECDRKIFELRSEII